MSIVPIPVLEVFDSTRKFLFKTNIARRRVVHMSLFNYVKAHSIASVQSNAFFLGCSVNVLVTFL
jgi:hypothetical protein